MHNDGGTGVRTRTGVPDRSKGLHTNRIKKTSFKINEAYVVGTFCDRVRLVSSVGRWVEEVEWAPRNTYIVSSFEEGDYIGGLIRGGPLIPGGGIPGGPRGGIPGGGIPGGGIPRPIM